HHHEVRAMIAKTNTLCARGAARRQAALYVSLAAASLSLPTLAVAAEETKTDTIGPWEIEATFKGDKFDRCTINRTVQDDIVATFARTTHRHRFDAEAHTWKTA